MEKNRFKQLLESKMGDVKPLLVETNNSQEFVQNNLIKGCFSRFNCHDENIFKKLFAKLSNTYKISKFNPAKIRINDKAMIYGREVLDVTLEDNTRILIYKSTGQNVQSTGKKSGEWFVIAGFAESGWFVKNMETIELTKGGNKYLTDFAQYLEENGSSRLGKDVIEGEEPPNYPHTLPKGFTFNSELLKQNEDKIDTSKIRYWDDYGGLDGYLKVISKAIKNNEYGYISRGGFEKFGISNFREFLKSSIDYEQEVYNDMTSGSLNKGFFAFTVK